MKTRTLVIAITLLFAASNASAQLWKKITKKVEQGAEEVVLRKTEQKTEQTLDSLIEKPFKKKKNRKGKNKNAESSEDYPKDNNEEKPIETEQPQVWSAYNFVPGDKIIFEDDLSTEENGEFPSRWDLISGNAENASYGEDNIINLLHKSKISPLMDEAKYLPEVFTIEFDAFFQRKHGPTYQDYVINLWAGGKNYGYSADRKNYCSGIVVNMHGASLICNKNGTENEYETYDETMVVGVGEPVWRHVALSFNKRSLKLFVDEKRVLNIPNLGYTPEAFVLGISAHYKEFSAIKNIRIAEGGKKLYDRVIADGKFITRGILFDVNSATIKPQSGGVLKKVATMMQEYTDLNFRIEGHTDSDGEESFNIELSEKRATAVMEAIINLGIDGSRLKAVGMGESVPVANNTSPEGKANNRRVEFVKF